jgi:hypothetical protein
MRILGRALLAVVLASAVGLATGCSSNSCCGACGKGKPCECAKPCCDACGRGMPCTCR